MGVKFANNAYGTLNASITNTDTSLTLSSGQGARFPSLGAGDYFYVTLIDTSNNLEIAKCTARSSDVLTITRGQEGTTARAYSVGDRVELRITSGALVDATAYDAVLPNQTGNSGEFLTTNGSTASWSALPPSNDASALTTGTLNNDRLAAGCIRQVLQWGDSSRYLISNPSGWTTISSVLSDGTPNITCADNNNKILVTVNCCFGQVDTWSSHGFRIEYSIGGAAWQIASGAQQTTWISSRSGGGNTATQIHLLELTTTSNVRFRLTFEAQDSGDYVRLNYGAIDNNGDNRSDYNQRSTITLQEVIA